MHLMLNLQGRAISIRILFVAMIVLGGGCSQRDGVRQEFSKEGQLTGEYTYVKGVREGAFREFDEDGRKIADGIIKGGKRHETRYTYYLNGKVKTQVQLVDDVRDGESKVFSAGGVPALERNYKMGKVSGIEREYGFDGSLEVERTYENDQLNGMVREYSGGVLRFEKMYVNNRLHGLTKEYAGDRTLKAERNYKDDLLDGISKEYDGSGNLVAQQLFASGQVDTTWDFYPDGRVMRETKMSRGQPAVIREYYNNPALKVALMRERFLEEGKTVQVNEYYETGNLMYRKYFSNEVIIRTEQFDINGNITTMQGDP